MDATEEQYDDETRQLLAESEHKALLSGTVREVAEGLGQVEDLDGLYAMEQAADKPRAGVLRAIEAERESRESDIEEPEAKAPEANASAADVPTVVKNVGGRPHAIAGQTIQHGERYTFTEKDLSDERLIAKVKRALQLGVLVEG